MLSLLLNETDCERSFSSDQRQSEGRRHRLLDQGRFDGLKVMEDGMAFNDLQVDGHPVNDFWKCLQRNYAKLFGTRLLIERKERKDKNRPGKRSAEPVKETLAGIKRRRLQAISTPAPPIDSEDVFGIRAHNYNEMKRLQRQECTDALAILAKAARAKSEEFRSIYERATGARGSRW